MKTLRFLFLCILSYASILESYAQCNISGETCVNPGSQHVYQFTSNLVSSNIQTCATKLKIEVEGGDFLTPVLWWERKDSERAFVQGGTQLCDIPNTLEVGNIQNVSWLVEWHSGITKGKIKAKWIITRKVKIKDKDTGEILGELSVDDVLCEQTLSVNIFQPLVKHISVSVNSCQGLLGTAQFVGTVEIPTCSSSSITFIWKINGTVVQSSNSNVLNLNSLSGLPTNSTVSLQLRTTRNIFLLPSVVESEEFIQEFYIEIPVIGGADNIEPCWMSGDLVYSVDNAPSANNFNWTTDIGTPPGLLTSHPTLPNAVILNKYMLPCSGSITLYANFNSACNGGGPVGLSKLVNFGGWFASNNEPINTSSMLLSVFFKNV